MKTRILLTVGAAALAAIALNVSASNALLSPRAAGNQIKAAPVAVATHKSATESQSAAVSPCARGHQTMTAACAANDMSPATQCVRSMDGSPKAIQACAANANMPDCPMNAPAGCMMR